jgi:uncharacterized protein YbjT (DUF2867 family)
LRVLVTGAAGFIGSAIVERLLAADHDVIACGRQPRNLPTTSRLTQHFVDFNHALRAEHWRGVVEDADAVVNCAGILRESRDGDFQRIHVEAPLALVQACREAGVSRFVQISALGDPDDGDFIASKHRLDDALRESGLDTCILRPSVVVSLRGSYGGTSMLRAIAALPHLLLLPGAGDQRIQPILLEDLAELTLRALTQPIDHDVIEAVGPEIVTLGDYLRHLRAWLKLPPARWTIHAPFALVAAAARIGDILRAGPMGSTMWRLLSRGNTGSPDATAIIERALSFRPRPVLEHLEHCASFVQDRWQARLYLLYPLVWFALVVIWLGSAAAGFVSQPADYDTVLQSAGVPETWHRGIIIATALWNLALGLWLASRRYIRQVLWLMLATTLAYTVLLTVVTPGMWLDLTGGLLKNLAVLVAVMLALVLEDNR